MRRSKPVRLETAPTGPDKSGFKTGAKDKGLCTTTLNSATAPVMLTLPHHQSAAKAVPQ